VVDVDGDLLPGIGTVHGNVNDNAASIAPGTSPGIIAISGDYN